MDNYRNKKWKDVQVASDLHLDQLTSYFPEDLIHPKGKILVLAGDICHIQHIDKHFSFFSFVSQNFEHVIYVPGNHEFYNDLNLSLHNMENGVRLFLKSFGNIYYLNNQSVVINNILFTGSCLWCCPNVNPPSWFKVNLNTDDIRLLYHESIKYLQKVSDLHYKDHIIVTHYPPIYIDILKFDKNPKSSSKYQKYIEYYQNNDIILSNYPKFWIFGHIHKNYSKFSNKTFYVSNQYKGKYYNPEYVL